MKKPLWTTILTCLTHMILPRLPAAQSTALEPWRSCCPGPKGRQPCSSSCWSVDTSPGIARVAVRWWGRHGWDMDVRYGGHSDTNTWMKHNKSLTWHKPVLSYLYFGIFTPILTIIPMTLPREVIIIYPEICRHRFRTRVGNKQNRWHFVHIHVHMHSHGNILSATSILQKNASNRRWRTIPGRHQSRENQVGILTLHVWAMHTRCSSAHSTATAGGIYTSGVGSWTKDGLMFDGFSWDVCRSSFRNFREAPKFSGHATSLARPLFLRILPGFLQPCSLDIVVEGTPIICAVFVAVNLTSWTRLPNILQLNFQKKTHSTTVNGQSYIYCIYI
jgi:hypothetical protein